MKAPSTGRPGIRAKERTTEPCQLDRRTAGRRVVMKAQSTGRPGISKRKKYPLMRPKLKRFPRTLKWGRRRRLKAAWCNIQPWLEYSQFSNSLYCYACRHFSTDTMLGPPRGRVFKNWKKATCTEFAQHAKSKKHTQAMIAWRDHQRAVAANPTSKKHEKLVKTNREYMKLIGRLLLLSVTQNGGHSDSESEDQDVFVDPDEFVDPDVKRTFMALLDLLAALNEDVKKRLSSVKNAVYISKVTQNEVLDCFADMVRSEITEELKHSEVFSIMVDDTRDMVSLVLRYYFNGVVQESFLQFKLPWKLDASGLTEKIIHDLEGLGLEPRNNLVAQAHSGFGLLSGEYSGVEARIKEQAKYGFYVHNNAHCLNVDLLEVVSEGNEFFDWLEKLAVFTSGFWVHDRWLEIQREMYEGEPRELQRVTDTQGACPFILLQNIVDRLPALMRVLHEVVDGEYSWKVYIQADNLLGQLIRDPEFIVRLVTLCKVFGETKPLSDMLQSSAPDLSEVYGLVQALVNTLTDFRQESSFFDNLWDEMSTISEQCDAAMEPTEERENGLSSGREHSSIMPTVDQKERFRVALFYPLIDETLKELNRRFSKTTCDIMNSIQALNPQSDAFLQSEVLLPFARLYDANIEHLRNELPAFSQYLERKIQTGMQRPSSTAELTLIIEPLKELFVELFRLSKIAVAIPVSAASSGNNSSKVNQVKDHLNSLDWAYGRMIGKMINLDVLRIEYTRARALCIDSFLDRFAKSHKNLRMMLL